MKKLYVIILLTLISVSSFALPKCCTILNELRPGMTSKEVIAICGEHVSSRFDKKTKTGYFVFIFRHVSGTCTDPYYVIFTNDSLEERGITDHNNQLRLKIPFSVEITDANDTEDKWNSLDNIKQVINSLDAEKQTTSPASTTDARQLLQDLKSWYEDGLITEDEYTQKRKEVLERL